MRLVDADEFKEKLGFLQKECEANQNYMTGVIHGAFQCCIEVIDEQPTIESAKQGHWMQSVDDYGCAIKICSKCGGKMPYIIPPIMSEDDWIEATDYCWKCGAKMDGENK